MERLLGKTLAQCYQFGDDEIHFVTNEGDHFKLCHYRDCCEEVFIESIAGNLDDLTDSPLIESEVVTSQENPEDAREDVIDCQDSFTWTFYKLRTAKGSVTIRWYGESNGYYSEEVDFCRVN